MVLKLINGRSYDSSVYGLQLNARDFGARGDGSTNDTAAIQAAITACNALGGGTVFLPAGTYLITLDSLLLHGTVSLRGVGKKRSILQAAAQGNGVLVELETGASAPAGPTTTEYVAHPCPTIRDLGFVYPPGFTAQTAGVGLYVHDTNWIAWGVHVDNCLFDGFWYNLHFHRAVICQVTRSHFWRPKKASIRNTNDYDTDQGDLLVSENLMIGDTIASVTTGTAADQAAIRWDGGAGIRVVGNKILGHRNGVYINLANASGATSDNITSAYAIHGNSIEEQGIGRNGAAVCITSVYGRGGSGTAVHGNQIVGVHIDHAECENTYAAIIDCDVTALRDVTISGLGYGTGIWINDGCQGLLIDGCHFRQLNGASGGATRPIYFFAPLNVLDYKLGTNNFTGYANPPDTPQVLVYSNDFEAETSGAIATGWTAVSGTWVVSGTGAQTGSLAMRNAAPADDHIVLYTGGSWADQTVQLLQTATFSGSDTLSASIVLRADATFANGYVLLILYAGGSGQVASLYKKVSGSYTQIGSNAVFAGVTNGMKVRWKFQAVGTTLRCKLWQSNDNEPTGWTGTWTDSTFSAAGHAGVRVTASAALGAITFDEFQVFANAVSS